MTNRITAFFVAVMVIMATAAPVYAEANNIAREETDSGVSVVIDTTYTTEHNVLSSGINEDEATKAIHLVTASEYPSDVSVQVLLNGNKNAENFCFTAPANFYKGLASANVNRLGFKSLYGFVELNGKAINTIANNATGDTVTFNMGVLDPDKLSEQAQQIVGLRPAFSMYFESGKDQITDLGYGGKAVGAINYTISSDEIPQGIIAYNVLSENKMIDVPYASAFADDVDGEQAVKFYAQNLHNIAIGYAPRDFDDATYTDDYVGNVLFVTCHKLIDPVNTHMFYPNEYITRGDFLVALSRLDQELSASSGRVYETELTDLVFTDAYDWAMQNAIAVGYDTGEFGEDHPITKEEAYTMLYNLANYMGLDTEADGMAAKEAADYESIKSWALPAIRYGMKNNMLNLDENGNINPSSYVKRVDAAALVQSFVFHLLEL